MNKIITIISFIKTQSSLTIAFNQKIAELDRAIAEIKQDRKKGDKFTNIANKNNVKNNLHYSTFPISKIRDLSEQIT